jgi:hypothetical protein
MIGQLEHFRYDAHFVGYGTQTDAVMWCGDVLCCVGTTCSASWIDVTNEHSYTDLGEPSNQSRGQPMLSFLSSSSLSKNSCILIWGK